MALDPETLPFVDAFTWHTINAASSKTFGNDTRLWAYGKVDYTNEMEYQPGAHARTRTHTRARAHISLGIAVWPRLFCNVATTKQTRVAHVTPFYGGCRSDLLGWVV